SSRRDPHAARPRSTRRSFLRSCCPGHWPRRSGSSRPSRQGKASVDTRSPRITRMRLSVVCPAYDEGANVQPLVRRLTEVLNEMAVEGEVVAGDDVSPDVTGRQIEDAARGDRRVRGLRLSRNFGHQVALTAGLWASDGDLVVTMDSDLQHPPEVIPS